MHYNAQDSDSYSLSVQATNQAAGTFVQSLLTTGNDGNGDFTTGQETGRGTFTSASTVSRSQSGAGTFTLSARGSNSAGCWSFTSFSLSQTAASTFSSTRTTALDTTINHGTYTDTGAGITGNFIVHGTFTAQGNSSNSVSQSGASSWSLSEIGAASGNSYCLSSYVYRTAASGTFSSTSVTTAVESGTDAGVESSTTPHNGNIAGYTSSYGTSHDSFASSTTTNGSTGGAFATTIYVAGSYANAAYVLPDVEYQVSNSDTWSQRLSDRVRTSGNSDITQTAVKQEGSSGNGPVSNTTATQHNYTSYQSTSTDTWAQSGSDTSTVTELGSFLSNSYSFNSVSFHAKGSQQATVQSRGTDTYSVTGSATTATWSNQGIIGPYGPAGTSTLQGIGSFTSVTYSSFSQSGNDSWSQSSLSAGSYSLNEAGNYAAGSYSLSCVAYTQHAGDTWSSTETGSTTTSGYGSSTATGLGCIIDANSHAVIASGSYQESSSGGWGITSLQTINQSGTDSSTQSQIGSYSGNTFSFNSVVFQQSGTQSGASWVSGQSSSGGLSQLQFTSQSHQAGAAGVYTGLSSATQTGLSNSVQSSTATFTANGSATSSWTSYQPGSLTSSGYALNCVSYSETDTGSQQTQMQQSSIGSGTDSWSGHTYTVVNQSSSSSTQAYSITGYSDTSSRSSDTYSGSGASTTYQSSSGRSSWSALGSYSHGSYAYGSVSYSASAQQTNTSSSSSGSTFSGAGSAATRTHISRIFSSTQGLTDSSTTKTDTNSSNSFVQSGSLSTSQSLGDHSSQNLSEQGSYALNSWTLSSIAYSATSAASSSLQAATASIASGMFTGTTGTITSDGAISGVGTITASTNVQESSHGTFSGTSNGSSTQSATAASVWGQIGSYDPTHGYSYTSAVFEANSSINGTAKSKTTGAAVTYSSSNQQAGSSNKAVQNTNGGLATTQSSGGTIALTTGYASGSSVTSLTETSGSWEHTYEAGSYSGGSYAFSSVNLSSGGMDSATIAQATMSNGSGTVDSTNTQTSSNSYNNPATFPSGFIGSGYNKGTSSGQTASVVSSTFNESSNATSTQHSYTTSSLSQRGSFAGGSYSFSSVVYRYQATASTVYQQSASGNLAADSQNSFTSTSSLSSHSYSFVTVPQFQSNTNNGSSTSRRSGGSTGTQTSNNSSTFSDNQVNSYSVYEAGSSTRSSAGQTLSLTSVVLYQTSSETTQMATTDHGEQDSIGHSLSCSASSVSYQTSDSSGISNSAQGTASLQCSTFTVSQTEDSTVQTTGTSQTSLYQAGTGIGTAKDTVFSFTSVVYRGSQNGNRQEQLQCSQTTVTSSTAQSAQNQSSSNSGGSTGSGAAMVTYSVGLLVSNTSLADVATNQSTYYAAGTGTSDEAAGTASYSLSSVNYTASATDSSTAWESTTSTALATSTSQQSSSSQSPGTSASTCVSTSQSLAEGTQQGKYVTSNSSESVSEKGSYGNGGFAYSTVNWSESVGGETVSGTNSSTSLTKGTTSAHTFLLTAGTITTNGSSQTTTTTNQRANSSNSDDSTQVTVIHELGSYAAGKIALSSLTLLQDNYDYNQTDEQATNTMVQNNSSSLVQTQTSSSGGTKKVNLLATTTTGLLSQAASQSGSTLYETGSMSAAGAMSLGCVEYDAWGSTQFTGQQTQDQNSTQTTVVAGFMAPSGANGSFTGVVGAGNLGTYVSLSTSQSTYDSVGCYSLADHEEGLYAGGEFYLDPVSWTESAGVQSVYDASSNQTNTAKVRGNKNLDSLSTSSTSVQCAQNYSARMTITKGEYWLDSWTLGSYVLTGTTSLAAQQQQSSGSNSTESGTDSSGNSFTQTSSSALSQSTVQSQSASIVEKGTYGDDSFNLSHLSLTATGGSVYNYKNTTSNTKTVQMGGSSGGHNSAMLSVTSNTNTVTASGQGNYNATSQGNYQDGVLALSSFTLSGSSTGAYGLQYASQQGQNRGGQTDTFNESSGFNATGNYSSSNGGGWSFGSYTSTQAWTDAMSDWGPGFADNATVSVSLTQSPAGAYSETAQGSFSWNGRSAYFNPTTATWSGAAITPQIPSFKAEDAAANWQVDPGDGEWTPPAQLNLLNQSATVKITAGATGPASGPAILVPQPAALTAPLPPLLAGLAALRITPQVQTEANGAPTGTSICGWFATQARAQSGLLVASGTAHPWGWLNQLGPNLLKATTPALQDVLARIKGNILGTPGTGGAGTAEALFKNTASLVNASIQGWSYWVGQVVDYVIGFLDGLTNGAFSTVINGLSCWLGLGNVVNTTSDAYGAGQSAGQYVLQVLKYTFKVVQIILTVFPPGAAVFWTIVGITSALALCTAVQQAIAGDWNGVAWTLAGLVASLAPLGLGKWSKCMANSALGTVLGTAAILGGAALGVGSAVGNVRSAFQQFSDPNGDPLMGVLDLLQAGADLFAVGKALSSACFKAGTPMRTPEGSKPIEEFKPGDFVLARDEFDPDGPVVAKVVEAVWVAVAPILNVHVGGRVIGTTPEHPFYVNCKGWTAAKDLRIGDLVRGEGTQWHAVEGIAPSGEVTLVYNMRVADFHTYFVGSDEWGFSVWANNACKVQTTRDASGRITEATARVTGSTGKGTDPTEAARKMIRAQGALPTDDAGHLIGNQLGGRGGARSGNIVAMDKTLNRGQVAQFENGVTDYIGSNSVAARIRVTVDYTGRSGRPSDFGYDVLFSDGYRMTANFTQ